MGFFRTFARGAILCAQENALDLIQRGRGEESSCSPMAQGRCTPSRVVAISTGSVMTVARTAQAPCPSIKEVSFGAASGRKGVLCGHCEATISPPDRLLLHKFTLKCVGEPSLIEAIKTVRSASALA
jgi:hypothetical protein